MSWQKDKRQKDKRTKNKKTKRQKGKENKKTKTKKFSIVTSGQFRTLAMFLSIAYKANNIDIHSGISENIARKNCPNVQMAKQFSVLFVRNKNEKLNISVSTPSQTENCSQRSFLKVFQLEPNNGEHQLINVKSFAADARYDALRIPFNSQYPPVKMRYTLLSDLCTTFSFSLQNTTYTFYILWNISIHSLSKTIRI